MGMKIERTDRGTLIVSCGGEVLELNATWVSVLSAGKTASADPTHAPATQPAAPRPPDPAPAPMPRTRDEQGKPAIPDIWPAPGDDFGVMVIKPIGDPEPDENVFLDLWSKKTPHFKLDSTYTRSLLKSQLFDPDASGQVADFFKTQRGILDLKVSPRFSVEVTDLENLLRNAPSNMWGIQLLGARDED